jgi:SAM-dependent methyltransferase
MNPERSCLSKRFTMMLSLRSYLQSPKQNQMAPEKSHRVQILGDAVVAGVDRQQGPYMSTSKFRADEPKQLPNAGSPAISAPAALRNREVIAEAIGAFLPRKGDVLELASGTGEHISLFAQRFDRLKWQPSELDPSRLDSIGAYVAAAALPNLADPVFLNVSETDWHIREADVILAINLLHVAPKSVSSAVLTGAAQVLRPGGMLILYGPFKLNGAFNAESNRDFDLYLRDSNPAWGLRNIADLDADAQDIGLARVALMDMPANNYLAVYRKPGSTSPD